VAGRGPLVVIGDALLDRDLIGRVERLSPDAPVPVVDEVEERLRPGGAGLAAVLAAAEGREVVLVTALADDAAGDRLRGLLDASVTVLALPLGGQTPEKTRVRAAGQPLLRLDRGGAGGAVGEPDDDVERAVRRAVRRAGAVLVADYGRGVAAHPLLREAVAAATGRLPVVWDPHPRGPAPVPGVALATPNADEARRLVPVPTGTRPGEDPDGLRAVHARASALVRTWAAGGVAVTLGPRGALLSVGDANPLVVPAPRVAGADPCGAGDRFSSAVAGLLADGAVLSEAVGGAVAAASAFVAAGGAGQLGTPVAPEPERPAAAGALSTREVVARARARGGTVVATGGCFDLLHAGHVATLAAARGLGDCLVVCLNSDASVRRLKGPDRPLVPERDRERVLRALASVDAVEVFDEDTPVAVLDRLRPDVWAKGGDYAGATLPETDVLARWGGQAVVLPYLAGRSTSRLVRAVTTVGGG
jgi:rfaE bifunctional protein nucleotidyltransferase chain/domain/rfaE bifunctional protein kinase chain/domain